MEHIPNDVTIYACGGAGINIVGGMPKPTPGMANALAYAIDTSKSNLRDSKFSVDHTYLFEGIDGSGKVRAENHSLIAKTTKAILQKFKPNVFNIVVSSGGGGSGGVIAGSIINELLEENLPVISIVIGSTNSQQEVDNTLKTLKTLDNHAHKHNQAVVVHYLENSVDASRKHIDGGAHAAIHALLSLFSGLNAELDTADLRNWIKKAGTPEVFSLQFCPTAASYAKAGTVISVATLARPDHNVALDPSPAYQTVGYITETESAQSLQEPLHFTLAGDLIDTVAKNLDRKKAENEKRLRSAVQRDRLVKDDDKSSDNGVVL
jgi:hypothetical protein